ncbi:MAG: sigma-70 family RNA polymerase sigma factor [Planctomycetota bacterium]|jgi:RNA polymerase sigma-70 factor (ECF subfamily)
MEMNDFDLAAAFIRSGDAAVFRQLVDRHSRLVFHLAYRLAKDFHEAEDVTQEVFVVILQRLRKYKEGKSFRAWAAGITLRVALRAKRKITRREKRERRMIAVSGQKDREEMGPMEAAEQKELSGRIERMLGDLPEENRVPIVLHYLEGFTYGEVGEAMGIPEGTVKSRIHRGLEQVRAGVERGGKKISAAALIPLFQEIPSPVVPAALESALYALPAKVAVSVGIVAKISAWVKGGISMKSFVAGLGLVLAIGAGAVLMAKAGPSIFAPDDEIVGLPPDAPEEDSATLPPLPPSGTMPESSLPRKSEVEGEGAGAPGVDSKEEGAGPAPGQGEPGGVRIGPGSGRVKRVRLSGKEGKPSIRKIAMEDALKRIGNIRFGSPGGQRFGPAGWSKWAPRPPAKGNCTLTGRVIDVNGAPVPGAVVYRMKAGTDRGENLTVSFGDLIKIATTDEGGAFRGEFLPAGEYFVAGNYRNVLNRNRGLYTAGAVRVSLLSGQTGSGVTIQLSVAVTSLGSLSGRIVDEDGAGIPRAEVCAGFSRTYSDTGGRFSIPSLPAGPATITASRTGYRVTEKEVAIIGGRALEGVTVVLPLKDRGEYTITGTVTDGTGKGVEGASIFINGTNRTLRSERTDATGQFRIEHIGPREVNLQVSKMGYHSVVKPVTLSLYGIHVLLEKNVVVTGFVKSAGTGGILDLFNMRIFREKEDGSWLLQGTQSRYSEDGSFRLNGRPGTLILEVEAPAHKKAVFEIEVPVEGDELRGVELLLEPDPDAEGEEEKGD